MSSTIIFPIIYATTRNSEGELVLHPAIKVRPVIVEDYGIVFSIESKFYFTLDNITFLEIEFGKSDRDLEHNDVVIFTGFYSSASNIIGELGIPNHQVQWVS